MDFYKTIKKSEKVQKLSKKIRDGKGTMEDVNHLAQAVSEGVVGKDECIMLNCTGGGTLGSMAKGYVLKEPDLVLDPSLPAEEIIAAVRSLF